MNKITMHSFKISISLFGAVALFTSLIYALIMSDDLTRSDDPYIIGLVIACITSFASLIYLLLNELKFKWLNSKYCVTAYYIFLILYCLFIEYVGGEVSGYGYFFLAFIALSLPAFILAVIFQARHELLKYGAASGFIYLLGYIYVLSSRI